MSSLKKPRLFRRRFDSIEERSSKGKGQTLVKVGVGVLILAASAKFAPQLLPAVFQELIEISTSP